MKELKVLKLKDLITLQNCLFVKDSLTNEGMTSFDKIFQQSTTTRYQNTRSASSFQLRKHDFKTEKYGRFSIINKCLSDWNQLQKHLKTNFKDIKRSELKTIVTNHLLKQYVTYQNYERKTETICLNYPSLSSISLSLSKHVSLFVFYHFHFLFFPPVPGISILKFSRLTWLSSPTTATYYIWVYTAYSTIWYAIILFF